MAVLDFDFITAIEGGSNMFWQCHWDGCQKMVTALKDSIEDHLELVHGFHLDMDRCHPWVYIQCRWKPAMFVDLMNGQRVSASTHSLSYYCGQVFRMSEMAMHVAYPSLRETAKSPCNAL